MKPAFPSTKRRLVEFLNWDDEQNSPSVPDDAISLVIVGGELTTSQLNWTKTWTQAGGQSIFVARNTDQALQIYELLEAAPTKVQEATSSTEVAHDYTMLEKVDLSHPVFQQFDDPRFSDFTKLKFWKHRQFNSKSFAELHILAEFDDESPAIAEIPLQKGRLMLFASGWNRNDSEWAVSTKFVPMMNALLEYGSGRGATRPQYHVHDSLIPGHFGIQSETTTIQSPSGDVETVNTAEPYQLKEPGIYRIATDEAKLDAGEAIFLAANLLPEESQISPLSLDVLTANGIQLVNNRARAKPLTDNQRRQLMNEELESRQQLWKWLLVGAGGLLLVETLLSGWLGYRREGL